MIDERDKKMSLLLSFCDSLQDEELRETFSDALMELAAYRRCGSVEDCQSRMEWMSFSMDDVRKKFIDFVRMMQQEVEEDRKYTARRRKK